jgi:hypothetical protein
MSDNPGMCPDLETTKHAIDHAPRRTGRRLTLFAKGNNDVRDSLHSLRIGGEVRWNGINEVVRARFPGTLVRVRHEVWTRSDALLAADGRVPAELAAWPLPLSPHTPAVQFSDALFATDADAIVLSIQPDLVTHLSAHRRDGYLFYPHNWLTWPAADKARLAADFAAAPLLDADASMRNFARIVARIRERSAAPILIYNLSAVVPGDTVHCHLGLGEILSTRIRRFNLGLADLSARTGISVIDVDAVLARAGAARLKLDALHVTPEGQRLVAEEVVRVLEDLGCLAPSDVE